MQYELELKKICKRFGEVVANHNVDLQVRKGEVHAIVGENGAGKTTLMNILYGVLQPDSGEILYQGRPVRLHNSQSAINIGIGMVHQHFMLAPSMTVAENIALGKPPKGNVIWNPRDLEELVLPIMRESGMDVDLNAKVQDISVGQMQRVEIIKTLYRGAKIIIMDEPTATLTPIEVNDLFVTIRRLTNTGHTVLFITHKLREVMEISNRVTALRQGTFSGTANTVDVTTKEIAHMMIGRDLAGIKKKPSHAGKTALRVENLNVKQNIHKNAVLDVSFELSRGEILGVAGVEGNGQKELAESLLGLRPVESGKISVFGEDVTAQPTKKRLNAGVGYIPPDRMVDGLALDMSVTENLIIGNHDRPPIASRGFIRWKLAKKKAGELIQKYSIKTPSGSETAKNLSGGNLQKIIIGREMESEPHLFIANQPTRGVDIGSSEQIRETLMEIRNHNGAVLLVSADLDEILELSDRIIVMYEGRNVGEIEGSRATEELLGNLMFGITGDK